MYMHLVKHDVFAKSPRAASNPGNQVMPERRPYRISTFATATASGYGAGRCLTVDLSVDPLRVNALAHQLRKSDSSRCASRRAQRLFVPYVFQGEVRGGRYRGQCRM